MDDYYSDKARITKLMGQTNYRMWSVQINAHLLGKDAWDPIEYGAENRPKQGDSIFDPEQVEKDKRNLILDAKARAIIMATCSESVLLYIIDLDTTKKQ
jgi:hypothetical protein